MERGYGRFVVYLVRFLLIQAAVTVYLVVRQITLVENIEPVIIQKKVLFRIDEAVKKIQFPVPQKTTPPSNTPVKVVIISYMRGGSTILGEIFNQNPSAAYWFESIDGAYAALYGLEYGIRTHEITHHNNRTFREPPELERTYVLDVLEQMLTCDLNRLPIEIIEHPFMVRGRQKGFEAFAKCVTKLLNVKIPLLCRNLHPLCQRKLRVHHVDRCAVSVLPFLRNASRHFEHFPVLKVAQKLQNHVAERYSQQKCYKGLLRSRTLCGGHLETACKTSKIRALKTVRLTMADVEVLLRKHPDVKIIHILRDPRGIVASRAKVGLLSEQSFSNKALEGKMLCDLMRRDINKRKELELKNPGNFLTLTYEYFAEHPVEIAEAVYKHINQPMPRSVSEWLYNSTHAQTDSDHFKTSRKNATATAYSWKTSLSKQELHEIGLFCADLYNQIPLEGFKPVGADTVA